MAYRKSKIIRLAIYMVAFLAIYTFAAIVAFNGGLNDNERKRWEDPDTITVVLDWPPNTNHTGVYVAKELGYFDEEGLVVNIFQPPEGGATLLVASGKAQFGVDFQDFLAPAFSATRPIPVKAVATIMQHNTSGIISRKEIGVFSPKDMEHKRYATWDNPMEQKFLSYLMEKQGANFNKVDLVHASIDNLPVALQRNIDCAWGYFGLEAIVAQMYGVDCSFFFFKDIDRVFDYYAPVIVANDEFVEKYPKKAKKFLKAVARGYVFSAQNPKRSAEILLKAVPELNKNLVIESQNWISKKYIEDSTSWGVIDKSRWDRFYAWLYREGIIDRDITEIETFTNKFLPGAIT